MHPLIADALGSLLETAEPGLRYTTDHKLDLALIRARSGGVLFSKIRVVPPRGFEPDPGGRLAAWIEARDEWGRTVDIVGWSMRNPSKVVTLMGQVALLGLDLAVDPIERFGDAPLRIHRHPLGWLQAGCDGVVGIDGARAARELLSLPSSTFEVEDDAHGREIARSRRRLFRGQSLVTVETA